MNMSIVSHIVCLALLCLPTIGFSQNRFTTADWQQDLAFLRQELPQRHVDLYRHYPQLSFEADLTALEANLAGKSDLQVALALQAILVKVQDRDTRLDLTPILQKQTLIPLALGIYEGGLYVVGTVKRFETIFGQKILAINQMPIDEVLQRLGKYTSADNDFGRLCSAHLTMRFPAVLRAAGIANNDTLTLLTETAKGQKEVTQVFPVPLRDPKVGASVAIPSRPKWGVSGRLPFEQARLFGDSVLYVHYGSGISREVLLGMGDTLNAPKIASWQTFTDSLVDFLQARPYAKLMIDLQYHSFGVPTDGVAFAQRIGSLEALNKPSRLFVAINGYTGGSGALIAAAFQRYTKATLIGEPTGTGTRYFSNARPIVLPRTGLVLYATTKDNGTDVPFQDAIRPAVSLPLPMKAVLTSQDPLLLYIRKQAVSE